MPVAAPGFDGVVKSASTPAFSPDGKFLAFNRYNRPNPSAHNGTPAKALAMMNFDAPSRTFSNLVEFAQDAALIPSWPSFTPDSKWLVYQLGTKNYTLSGALADLAVVHTGSRTVAKLDVLNGYLGGKTYLPAGEAEAHLNYEPTVLPVAAGGYYWVVFTSRRTYGNTITSADAFERNSARKKLWVAALDIDTGEIATTAARDISHPPFYLPGQELAAGNMRGFWALDPCKQNGDGCESGDECCKGFCRQAGSSEGGAPRLVCSDPKGCANESEACTVAADCCDSASGVLCINAHCARPAPR
jgi:hypothetical protein